MKNSIKKKLKEGQAVVGTSVGRSDPWITELISEIGYDWLLIDAEHGALDYSTIMSMLQSCKGTNCTPIVRVQNDDPSIIKRVLDAGAHGVVVPLCNTAEDAKRIVEACKYPPEGIRGFGPRRGDLSNWKGYFDTANEEIFVAVQLETVEGVNNAEEIMSVKGIDACIIGPADLSISMGLGIPPKLDEPTFKDAIDRISLASYKTGVPCGGFFSSDQIEWAVKEKGFTFNAVDDVDTFIINGAISALKKARNAMSNQYN